MSFWVERSCSFKFVSGKQCEGERRLDRLSSVFGHSRKVGFPDFRCVQVGIERAEHRLVGLFRHRRSGTGSVSPFLDTEPRRLRLKS